MTRHFLRSMCKLLAEMVLMAQLAVSAHACPGMQLPAAASMGSDQNGGGAAVQSMPGCADMQGAMDPSFANLCAEHCKHGQQSDQAPTLILPATLLTALYTTPPAPEPDAVPRPAAEAAAALVAASPPHAILHCCFRI
jgi:hypothetical protein